MAAKRVSVSFIFGAVAPLLLACGAGADNYSFTVNQPSSSITYTFNANAPFAGTMVGENSPTKPANQQTRTKQPPANLFQCGSLGATQNDLVDISGAIAASGTNSGGTPVRPTGSFKLDLNTTNNTCVLRDATFNFVASGAIEVGAVLDNLTYEPFCAINPSCHVPIALQIDLPLGDITIASLVGTQAPGNAASGTLTPAGANTWTFTIPVTLTVTPGVTFGGNPFPADPQAVPTVLAGTVTTAGATATITANAQVDFNPPPITTPTPQAPAPFTIPADSALCPNLNLILALTINSSTITNSNTIAISAGGTRIACPCDADGSGMIEVADIFEFLNRWFAGNAAADFNGGGLTVSDIFDFLNCWFTPPAGC